MLATRSAAVAPLPAGLTLAASAAQMVFLVAAELMPTAFSSSPRLDRESASRRADDRGDLARLRFCALVPIAARSAPRFAHLYAWRPDGEFAVMFDISGALFVSVVPRRDVVDANSKLAQRACVLCPPSPVFLVQA